MRVDVLLWWLLFVVGITLLSAFALKDNFGLKNATWAWIEVWWSGLSIIALCLGFLQLNDKINDANITNVHASLVHQAAEFNNDLKAIFLRLSDAGLVKTVDQKYNIKLPAPDDLGFERRLVASKEPVTAEVFAHTAENSKKLCTSVFDNSWKYKVGGVVKADPGDDSGSNEQFFYFMLAYHCNEALSISASAEQESSLIVQSKRRDIIYGFGWLWAYVLGFGLGLKLLKAINDLVVEKRKPVQT
jgi:hypothetical protein